MYSKNSGCGRLEAILNAIIGLYRPTFAPLAPLPLLKNLWAPLAYTVVKNTSVWVHGQNMWIVEGSIWVGNIWIARLEFYLSFKLLIKCW